MQLSGFASVVASDQLVRPPRTQPAAPIPRTLYFLRTMIGPVCTWIAAERQERKG